jgi:hypothetical protein
MRIPTQIGLTYMAAANLLTLVMTAVSRIDKVMGETFPPPINIDFAASKQKRRIAMMCQITTIRQLNISKI